MTSQPVPFYILCGSLGAGKTTLLMRLLAHWRNEGRRVGVLMNEAGDVSIDGPRAGTIADQVLSLAGGCVCCDTKEELGWGIAQLVREYASDVLILECSGMADPAEVVDAVTDLYTARLARLERIIALLHPVGGDRDRMGGFITRQAVRCADELVLNKKDLYVTGHWEEFKASVTSGNSYARVWETSHARLDLASLLEPIERASVSIRSNVTFDKQPVRPSSRAPYHPIATTIRLPGPLNRERFLQWTRSLPQELERAKGFFRFSGEPELQEFQFSPPFEATTAPLTLLDEPDHAIVLIGRGYEVDRCTKDLLTCVEGERR